MNYILGYIPPLFSLKSISLSERIGFLLFSLTFYLLFPVLQNAFHLLVFSIILSVTFLKYGEFGAVQYFTDHQTANTIHLFVAIKGNFSDLFFF